MKIKNKFSSLLVVGFFIALPNVVLAQQDILKVGGVDDAGVANAYYSTIDPNNLRLTQDQWKDVNGFNDPINKIIEATGYFNHGDLSFWRSIEMVRDKRSGKRGNIGFTTANYATEADALTKTNIVSIVNMEYSPGPDGERITQFYVYANDAAGERRISTSFDARGEELFLPAACFSCHGGDDGAESPMAAASYDGGSGETNATFLAFDVHTMSFGDTTRASLEKAFKKMNKAVLRTNPTRATKKLIKGLYGGKGLPSATQIDGYMPADWAGEEELYHEVVVPSCRLCHTAADTKVLGLAWWKANPGKIREVVFHEDLMPNSLPVYERFWDSTADPVQWEILLDALNRFETP
ncbi:hypothetical protein N8198_06950 [Gammaproteobacteria bacterium]|nr:hypothetical protein [Gammaproteobacteria bacterium]